MRKGNPQKRILLPDPKFNDILVTRFVNDLMIGGKKNTAYNIFYKAIDLVEKKSKDTELTSPQAYVLSPKDINWYLPDQYNEMVKHLTQYEPADRPSSMTVVIKMLKDLIKIIAYLFRQVFPLFNIFTILILIFIVISAFGRTITWRTIKYKMISPTETIVIN